VFYSNTNPNSNFSTEIGRLSRSCPPSPAVLYFFALQQAMASKNVE